MQVKFKFHTDKIGLPNSHRYWSDPKIEKCLSLTRIECLAHILDSLLLILDKVFVCFRLIHLLNHSWNCVVVSVAKEIFLDRRVYILLSCCKLIKVHLRVWARLSSLYALVGDRGGYTVYFALLALPISILATRIAVSSLIHVVVVSFVIWSVLSWGSCNIFAASWRLFHF